MNTEIERGQERLIHTYQVHSQEPYAVFLSKPMGLFPKQLNWKHHGKDECLPSQRHYDKKRKKNKMIQDKRKKKHLLHQQSIQQSTYCIHSYVTLKFTHENCAD